MFINQHDFHFHAGQEREPGKTLRDHLEMCRRTNRRIIGVTDHYNYYSLPQLPIRKNGLPWVYPTSYDGLREYRDDLDSLKSEYPELKLYFCPEISPRISLDEVPDSVIEMSDYFICELWGKLESKELTLEMHLARMEECAAWAKKIGRAIMFAHPFRDAVNKRIVKVPIEPWITALEPRRDYREWSSEEIFDFYFIDPVALGKKAAELQVPFEVNGETVRRIRFTNLIPPLQMFMSGLYQMHKQGCKLVPGSDQHGFTIGNHGSFIFFEMFDLLGISGDDIDFSDQIERFKAASGIKFR
jgi:hypothetical protein